MKIAILFRGPIRPSISSVIENRNLLLDQFDKSFQITTFLATWNTWKNIESKDLLSQGLFDTVLSQPMPTTDRIKKYVTQSNLPNSTQTWRVFNMYYQSLTALKIIKDQDDYDFIIHTRPDCKTIFDNDMLDWFDCNSYVTESHTNWWKKDWISVAPPNIMYDAWNYLDLENLGKMIDTATIPEQIIDWNIKNNNVKTKTLTLKCCQLDPGRTE